MNVSVGLKERVGVAVSLRLVRWSGQRQGNPKQVARPFFNTYSSIYCHVIALKSISSHLWMQMENNVILAPKGLESSILPSYGVKKPLFVGLKLSNVPHNVFSASQLSPGQWRYIIECFLTF